MKWGWGRRKIRFNGRNRRVGKGGGVDLEVGNWFPLDFDAGMRFVYVCVYDVCVCVCVRAYAVL